MKFVVLLLLSWIMWIILITFSMRLVGVNPMQFIVIYIVVMVGRFLEKLFREFIYE